jgi:glucose-1-phosphate cytidylyltransferase
VLCLGHRGEQIRQYFFDYEAMTRDVTVQLGATPKLTFHGAPAESWTVTLADTGAAAMTGARVKQIERHIRGESFLLTYGDGVADIDITRLVTFHRRHRRLATVTGVRPPSRFGELVVQGTHVVEFGEKPSISQGYINGGFFVFDRGVFAYLSDDDGCVLEREPLERLAKDGQLEMYPHEGYWQCMDTPRDLQHLTEAWQRPRPPWKQWTDDA